MTRHLYLAEDLPRPLHPGDQAVLTGGEAHHLLRVKRARAGEEIFLSDGAGRRFIARLDAGDTAKKAESAHLTILADASPANHGPRLGLIQAIAKGGRDLAAIEAATEVGAREIIAWQAERSIASWPAHKASKSKEKWENTVRAAAKQARRATIPTVCGPLSSAQLRAHIAARVQRGEQVIILHEDAERALGQQGEAEQWENAGAVVVVVGPEGGITPQEIEEFVAAGARLRHCGPDIMRTSTAGVVALGVIRALSGGWQR